MIKASKLLNSALTYAERGWPVLPLHWPDGKACSCSKPDCTSVAKHPLTVHGLTDASADRNIIREWWGSYPQANVGLRTGRTSGLLVLDIDARHNGEKSLSALEDKLGPLPDGPRVKTGGGQHLYFSYPGFGVKSRAGLGGLPGCDVRAKKGYVVAPPSLHRSGLRYSWESEVNGKLPALPKMWIKCLVGHDTTTATAEDSHGSGMVRAGGRNDRLTRLAGALRRQGANEKTILAALLEFNENQCNPPLTELEVGKIAASVARHPSSAQDSDGSSRYIAGESGLVWLKAGSDGCVPVSLTNFTARLVADVIHDDGQEKHRHFELEATLNDRVRRFDVPASQFASMRWVEERLGAKGIVYPGSSIRDHARVAIQSLSEDVETHRVYAHTGWRRIGNNKIWAYLHRSGAITASGLRTNVAVELPANLRSFELPAPPVGDELKAAIKSSLRILDLTRAASTAVPLYGAIWRAALGPSDLTVHLAGRTGVGKSELGALAQQHYGKGFNARNLPVGWSSTGNSIEGLAFVAKDALLVVDDFAPGGTGYDVARAHREADRVIRAQGNNLGRARMRADSSLRLVKSPRGLILSSGEDTPRGQSTRARMLVIELGPEELDFERLSQCQRDARKGIYAKAFAGYLQWLAPRYGKVRAQLHKELAELREVAASSAAHKRTPEVIANLALGLRKFLEFALASGALSKDEGRQFWKNWWHALGIATSKQSEHVKSEDVAQNFVALLESVFASGAAHLADADGYASQHAKGPLIGWMDGDDLLLEPNAAFASVQRLAREQGESLPVGQKTLWKRLQEAGLIAKVEKGRNLIRREVGGTRRRVVCLRRHKFPSLAEKSGLPGFSGPSDE